MYWGVSETIEEKESLPSIWGMFDEGGIIDEGDNSPETSFPEAEIYFWWGEDRKWYFERFYVFCYFGAEILFHV